MIIINYHNILPQPPNPFFAQVRREWQTRDAFEQQIVALRSRFRMVNLQEIVEALKAGKKHADYCAVTFDDGNFGAYHYGLPILEKHGVPATFFIITGQVENDRTRTLYYFDWLEAALFLTRQQRLDLSDFGLGEFPIETIEQKVAFFKWFRRQVKVIPAPQKRHIDATLSHQLAVCADYISDYLSHEAYRMMNWQQIADFRNRGGTVGAHTRTHPSLSQIDRAQLELEICGSLQDVRAHFDDREVPFAYPYGNLQHVSPAAIETARRAGFSCAVTMFKGKNKPGVDLFQLRRMDFQQAAKKCQLTVENHSFA